MDHWPQLDLLRVHVGMCAHADGGRRIHQGTLLLLQLNVDC